MSHDPDSDVATAAIVSLGLVASGTNNSRCATALRSLASYYTKEPGLLFAVRLAPGGRALVLEAALPPAVRATDSVLATSYGYGDIPLMNVYDVDTGLPVLPWNRSIGLLVED